MSIRLAATLRLASTAALLGVLAWQLDVGELASRLGDLSPGWIVLGVLLSVPQVILSAFRWRLTATQLDIPLSWGRAIREYYLATFLNQVLPGGVMGDATRAWRHASDARDESHGGGDAGARCSGKGAAVRAVIIERASGQLALALVAIATLFASPALREAVGSASLPTLDATEALLTLTAFAALMLVGFVLKRTGLRRRLSAAVHVFVADLRRGIFEAKVWPLQLASSLLVVASYVAVFLCAAMALGTPHSLLVLLPLIPPLLMAMAIPVTVAGWGIREGAAALLWPLAGLPAQEGVTLSFTYGLLILAGSLPGALVLAVGRRRKVAASRRAPSGEAMNTATPSEPY